MAIVIYNWDPSHDLDAGHFTLEKNTSGNYELKVLSKKDWKDRYRQKPDGTILNLGKIIEIFNNKNTHTGSYATITADKITARMTQACKKHNDSALQWLKYLIIPWIFAKIFGWTCMTIYESPAFKLKLASGKVKIAGYVGPEFDLKQIETLDLRFGALNVLDPLLFDCVKLKNLNLGINNLRDLPADFEKLSQLENLCLKTNPLNQIPEVIFKLKNLKKLNISNMNFLLSNVNFLVDKNYNLPWKFGETAKKFSVFKQLKELDLSGSGVPKGAKDELEAQLPSGRVIKVELTEPERIPHIPISFTSWLDM